MDPIRGWSPGMRLRSPRCNGAIIDAALPENIAVFSPDSTRI
jgi:hypothetical protein